MATKVFETDSVTLMDGTKISLRPLKISLLREFMARFDELGAVAESNGQSLDVLIDCVAIAMKQYSEKYSDKDVLEENIDLPAVYKVIEVASGIKFDDSGNVTAAGLPG